MTCGMVVFQNAEELDLVGPWECVGMWGKFAGGPDRRLIVAESMEPVICAKGLVIQPHIAFAQCPALDYLLVPGGEGVQREMENPRMLDFLSAQARQCLAVLSVCTGSLLLHRAGLLSGKRATTHWASLNKLRAFGDVTVVEERFVQDGKIWTSAGVSAGIDMLLAFIESCAGERAAGAVQLAAEYFPAQKIYAQMDAHPQAPAYIKPGKRV